MAITIRPFEQTEWALFKEFRMQALRAEPGIFLMSQEEEAGKSPEYWQQEIRGAGTGDEHQVFGLFDDERLIGITACFTWREDPSGETALLAMSFILPEYRGRGLSNLFYEARLDWIRMRKQFKRVVVSHRASNEVSRRANQRHGFVETGRASRKWPDGATEDEISYEMQLL